LKTSNPIGKSAVASHLHVPERNAGIKKGLAWCTWAWCVLFALGLHALGVGPIAFIDGAVGPRSGVVSKAAQIFLFPLAEACGAASPLDDFLTDYTTTCHEAGHRFRRSVSEP
jgi:hypothetical protein